MSKRLKKLIDECDLNTREKLIELLKDTRNNAAWHHWGYEESADHLIANDVVQVLRCKDCKYWAKANVKGERWCTHWKGLYDYCKADDFCSYGERKDNGNG